MNNKNRRKYIYNKILNYNVIKHINNFIVDCNKC